MPNKAPANWEEKKLGELCKIYTGNSINEKIKKDKYTNINCGYNYIATKDIDFASNINYENGIKIPYSEPKFKNAPPNTTLLCIEGGSAGKKIGFTNQPVCFVNKLCAFVPIEKEKICSKYIYYYLQSNSFKNHFYDKRTGLIGGVSTSKLKLININFPLLSEQERIVRILDEVFENIEKAKQNTLQNLNNAKELFEAFLMQIFSNSNNWERKKLEDVAIDFGRGRSRHRPRNDKKLYGGKYPFIQTGDVRNSNHFITEYSQTYNDAGLAQSKLWPKGTLCITIAANIAETGILTFDACFPDSVIGCVFDNNETNIYYVEYLLQSFKSILQAEGKGSAQDNINLGTFEKYSFPFPEKETQDSIVKKLDNMREFISNLEQTYNQKLKSLEELKQSILQKAFNGEL